VSVVDDADEALDTDSSSSSSASLASSAVVVGSLSGGLGSSSVSLGCSSGAGDASEDDAVNESIIAPPSSSTEDGDEFLVASPSLDVDPSASFCCCCFRSPAMAALMSIGHIEALIYGGTCTSNVRQISIIC
jgi:hypothetical protein